MVEKHIICLHSGARQHVECHIWVAWLWHRLLYLWHRVSWHAANIIFSSVRQEYARKYQESTDLRGFWRTPSHRIPNVTFTIVTSSTVLVTSCTVTLSDYIHGLQVEETPKHVRHTRKWWFDGTSQLRIKFWWLTHLQTDSVRRHRTEWVIPRHTCRIACWYRGMKKNSTPLLDTIMPFNISLVFFMPLGGRIPEYEEHLFPVCIHVCAV